MANFGKPQKGPDDTEGYASITLTLKNPDSEIKTIACFIKNDLILQELQRENQSDLYVRTHKETKFFLYFFCSQSNLSSRLVESEIVAHRYTKPTKDKNCIIENKLETQPFVLKPECNHVFFPACHEVFKTVEFENFLTNNSSAITIKNISAGKYRGVQNSNAQVKYFSFSLSSSNGTLNIPIPSSNVFQNLVDGPLLLFEEASERWKLIGWYKNTPAKNRIIIHNLIAQDTTDIWKTSISNQTDGNLANQPHPGRSGSTSTDQSIPSGSADPPTSTSQPIPSGSADPPTRTDQPIPSGSADQPTSTDQANQSGSDTGASSPNNVQGAPTNLVLEATTAGMTITCKIPVGGSDVVGTAMILDQFMGSCEKLALSLSNQRNMFASQGVDVSGVDSGSIIIHLRVKTIEALEELWQRYKNGYLRESLERVLITDEIRKLGKTIEMVVTMSEEQYQDARSFLGEITQHKEKGNPVLLVGEVMKLILDHEEKIKFLEGFPAAVKILQSINTPSETQPRVAFDLDAVLFSDESERIFKEQGLDAFLEHEIQNRDIPLKEGPLKPFAEAFGRIQRKSDRSMKESCPIRTYIITSRDALVGQRALLTLRSWGLEIDKCFFLAGAPNDEVLKAVNPHIFFDDQFSHIHRAREKGTPSGDVTHGVTREDDEKKRGTDFKKTINVAVSSKALFNLEEEHGVFEEEGLEKYIELQLEREDQILDPGAAFPFIKALQNVNAKLKERDPKEKEIFTITLMSHDNAQVGIRLQKSIEHHGLIISRMALTCGESAVEYLKAFNITLFLTSYENEVTDAIRKGFPAAVMSLQPMNTPSETQLRIAFGLDAVLFSDDSERIYQAEGLTAFLEHEIKNKDIPLKEGPLKPFAKAIGRMQKKFARSSKESCPIRTYIVTSRDAAVGQRALLTLRSWGLEIDASHFLAGTAKDEVLKVINPHIFFDDQFWHVHRAWEKGTPSGHVTHGVTREYDEKKRESSKKSLEFA